jgi:hypothetical protein
MTASSTSGLVAVHIGQPAPGEDRWAKTPPIEGVDWAKHGVDPRFLGMDTSECAAAINPSIFSQQGATELDRFLAGTVRRDETAILVSAIGADETSSIFGTSATMMLQGATGWIHGQRLGAGTKVSLAPDLEGADRDLGMRIVSSRPSDAPWWSLSVASPSFEGPMGEVAQQTPPPGTLSPILIDGLGQPVLAVWVPAHGRQRWYVVPDAPGWDSVMDWLVRHALPEFVPAALRRVRAPSFQIPSLETARERSVRQALEDLDARYQRERAPLQDALDDAKRTADPIRNDMLFGTGDDLQDALAVVLGDAGFDVTPLDERYGTVTADLLVDYDGERRLVEVKSAGGRANENMVSSLGRHLATWPQLEPSIPIGGGVLVVNDQHKLDPDDRVAEVYERREFVDSLAVVVLSTRALYELWRNDAFTDIRAAVLAAPNDA